MKNILFAGILVSCAAVALSPIASSLPDGLEHVALRYGLVPAAVMPSPVKDYSFPGVSAAGISAIISGFIGLIAVFGAIYALGMLLRRKK